MLHCPVVIYVLIQSKCSFAHYFVYQVAFSSVLVVDAGRTAILQFGRSAKEIRGKGIFHHLVLREFAEFVYPKFPRIVRVRTSSVNTDFWDSKKDGTKVLLRRVLLHYCFVRSAAAAATLFKVKPEAFFRAFATIIKNITQVY